MPQPLSAPQPRYFAYLRVSTDAQDTANQKLGLLEYANARGFAPLEIIEDTASGKVSWRKRGLGKMLSQTQPGDVILAAEISRVGRSTLQVLEFIEEAAAKNVQVHITKDKLVLDDSIQSTIYATVFGMAAQIERKLISMRTREALQRKIREGHKLGRPKGSQGALKLDGKELEIAGYLSLGLSETRIARRVGTTPKTLARFIKRRKVRDITVTDTKFLP